MKIYNYIGNDGDSGKDKIGGGREEGGESVE